MKILLVNPKLFSHLHNEVKLPPLGLTYIASVLRENNYEVIIFDGNCSRHGTSEFIRALKIFRPDVVGITLCTPQIRSALDVASLVKIINRNTVIIMGGVHPTIFPREIAKEINVDFVVYGEGEETVVELLQAINGNLLLKNILGIVYKKDGRIIINNPRPLITDLDKLPFPAYDLLQLHYYNSPQLSQTPFISMITSRGCPYHCIFCDAHVIFGRKYRFHSPERTIKEIEYLIDRFQIRQIIFKDSEFTFDRDRLESLCDVMIKKKLPLQWSCNGRVGNVNLPLLKKMRQAGCRLVQYGVESGNQAILDLVKKEITLEQIKKTFHETRAAGIKTLGSFMIGHPGETKTDVESTISLAKTIKADFANFSFLIPYPGTQLYKIACKSGWLTEKIDIERYKCDDYMMNATCMTDVELSKMFKKMYISFYLRPSNILKRIWSLKSYEWLMNIKGLIIIAKMLWGKIGGKTFV